VTLDRDVMPMMSKFEFTVKVYNWMGAHATSNAIVTKSDANPPLVSISGHSHTFTSKYCVAPYHLQYCRQRKPATTTKRGFSKGVCSVLANSPAPTHTHASCL